MIRIWQFSDGYCHPTCNLCFLLASRRPLFGPKMTKQTMLTFGWHKQIWIQTFKQIIWWPDKYDKSKQIWIQIFKHINKVDQANNVDLWWLAQNIGSPSSYIGCCVHFWLICRDNSCPMCLPVTVLSWIRHSLVQSYDICSTSVFV